MHQWIKLRIICYPLINIGKEITKGAEREQHKDHI